MHPTTRSSCSTSTAWARTGHTSFDAELDMKKTIHRMLLSLAVIVLNLAAPVAPAALNIFACEPEWGALAKELAGDKASIYTATTALQDPHRIEARPSLIARARSADLAVC